MRELNAETLASLRRRYPAGARVELLSMNDPYIGALCEGCLGMVSCVDDVGTIHVNWDCGSSLGVAYGMDSRRVVEKTKEG